MVVQFIVFFTLSTLICRGTDISKYFSESIGIRDNESRLYIVRSSRQTTKVYKMEIGTEKTNVRTRNPDVSDISVNGNRLK